MNSNKILKQYLTSYQKELKSAQVTKSSKKYKNHNKLYYLNLTKIKFRQRDNDKHDKFNIDLQDPYQLIITNSLQNSSNNIFKLTTSDRNKQINKQKYQKIKQIVSGQLCKPQFINKNYHQLVVQQDKQENATAESPNSEQLKDQSQKQPQTQRKKLLSICALDRQSNVRVQSKKKRIGTLSLQKTQTKASKKKINANLCSLQKQIQNKQMLLPQIKLNLQKNKRSYTYNINQKTNMPLFFKDIKYFKNIKSQSYAILQYPTGQLIITNKSMNQYQIASLTKIMTFYTIQKIAKKYNIPIYHQKVQINDHATQMSGTSAQIKVGQIYTVQQLLYGLMLPSGNDAATALAQWGGNQLIKHQLKCGQTKYQTKFRNTKYANNNTNNTINNNNNNHEQEHSLKDRIKEFIKEMNINARQLGLKSTRYANQHGLCHNQSKSTAIDTGRLCLQCLNSQLFRKVVSTQQFRCIPIQLNKLRSRREVIWRNTNKLLRRQGFMGIKTGTTVTAGPCLTSAYKFRDKIYICTILRATKISRRFKQTRKLLAWSLQKLYKDTLTKQQNNILQKLKKNNPQLDSDYSDQQQQFNYDSNGQAQFLKRNHIVNYQM